MTSPSPEPTNFLLISPYPADSSYGGGQRLAGIIDALQPHGTIDLIVIHTPGPYPPNPAVRKTVFVDLREISVLARVGAFINKAVPFFLLGSSSLKKQVAAMCRETNYALILCRYPRTLERLGRVHHAKVVLDIDDNEYERKIQARNAATGWLAKAKLSLRAGLSLYLFKKVIRAADYLWIVKADSTVKAEASRTRLLPNVAFSIKDTPDPALLDANRLANTIVFIGHLAYPPNREGVSWFIRQVWPLIHQAEPALRLDIVGKCKHEPTIQLIERTPNARLRGFVPLLSDVYKDALLCINPCSGGSGTHIKIIEAMLHGRIVITTPFGVRGWEEANQECGCPIIAADAAEFAALCLKYYREKTAAALLQKKAYAFAEKNGTMGYFKTKVEEFLREILIVRS